VRSLWPAEAGGEVLAREELRTGGRSGADAQGSDERDLRSNR